MGRMEKIRNACLYVKQGTIYDCMCMFLDFVCVCVCARALPFMKVTICGVNESYLKAVKCNTAYSFKLFLPPGGNCNVLSLNFKSKCDWCD